jgi:hypothetical protein
MKAKLIHHAEEWLPGDFEAPAELASRKFLTVWATCHVPPDRVAMKLMRGAGLWQRDGKLLQYWPKFTDLAWQPECRQLWAIALTFGKPRNHAGVEHALLALDSEALTVQRQTAFCVRSGSPEFIAFGDAHNEAIITWMDQNVSGYVGIDLAGPAQTGMELYWKTGSLPRPAFAPGSRVVVACHGWRSVWWNDEIDGAEEVPSPGGRWKVGDITVHDLDADRITSHPVLVTLREGWIPDRPDWSAWGQIWGPEFIDGQRFRIWLPDDTTLELQLPLGSQIEVDRPLRTTRPYL